MLRSLAKSIDSALLGGAIQNNRHQAYIDKNLAAMSEGLEYRFVSHYEKNQSDLLSRLCDQYGSDKGSASADPKPYDWAPHTYADYYSRLFRHCRSSMKTVFECGLGTNNPDIESSMGIDGRPGASLRIWRDYFPEAAVYGADIDRGCLFEDDRIRTFWVDQLDPKAIAGMWDEIGVEHFDLIIDDGLHTFAAGSCLFEHSKDRIAPDGIYIIEDVIIDDLPSYRAFFRDTAFDVDYVTLYRPGLRLENNNLIVIRHP